MPTHSAPDGTRPACRDLGDGDGDPVVRVPGGPTDSRSLGDLGGLSGHRRLALPDLRGTGRSAIPDESASHRCDRLVGDIEALRVHLGLDRIDLLGTEGTGTDWDAISPFFYGRWDAAARQHHADCRPANREAVTRFGEEGAFDPPAMRTALAGVTVPVLQLTGEFDLNSPPDVVAGFAGLFPDARLAVQPGAGHYPWLDDQEGFTAGDFLARP
ncbi:alpha/beta fold hydrolase [Streptomyces bauhiniae]|uniref:Alpha/beta hydrolase n=1 Tax=Streptomyces bauhiniae TaxID=2340725 RepID=A0A7K3R2N5_9ACTN|nr:alpha/beta hydrolase [Streptomyces bauhiniae]NEB96306.1 alpha/beta hydrolase [Streptomyces bauhiniae]